MSTEDRPKVDTTNEFVVLTGKNLPNHSTSMAGRPSFVDVTNRPTIRTKQQAYRLIAWVLAYVDTLPDEDGEHTLEEVQDAVAKVVLR